MIGYIR